MKKVKLPDGQVIQLPSTLSDLDVQRVVKSLMNKLGEIQAYEKGKEVVLINTQFPEFPKFPEFPQFPEQKDYSSVLKKIAESISNNQNENLKEQLTELNKNIMILSSKVDNQTEKMVKAITMQSDVLAELVIAYREPKKIIRDNQGRPEGIENVQ